MEDFEDEEKDFLVEQKTTERHLNQIKVNGFRDGTQSFMENEALIQQGFDSSYKIFSSLGFQLGEIRALGPLVCKDSCCLAKLNDKLDKIENFNYESRIHWSFDSSNVIPDFSQVIETVNYFKDKLNELKQILMSFSNEKSIQKLNDNLNKISIKYDDEQDDIMDEEERKNFKLLNNLIENWNF